MKRITKINARTAGLGCFLLLAASCISEKDIRLDPVLPRPVLNALLRPDAPVTVNVSVSSRGAAYAKGGGKDEAGSRMKTGGKAPAGGRGESDLSDDPSDVTNTADLFIDDAAVDLRVNGTSRGRFEKLRFPDDYSFPGYRPTAGDRVEITVCAPGFDPLTASTVIPRPATIAGVDTAAYLWRDDWGQAWEYLDANLLVCDLPGERTYYLLSFTPHQIWRKGTEAIDSDTLDRAPFLWSDIYSKEDFFLQNADLTDSFDGLHAAGASFLFTDEFTTGKPFRLHFTFSNLQYSYRDDTLSCINACRITLRSVSESYYLYRRSKILQKEQDDILGDTGLREPLPTYTNVKNGYGLLGAWQESTYELIFPFRADKIPYNNPFKEEEEKKEEKKEGESE